MKKNIIIAILTVVSLLSLTYGYYQKNQLKRIESNTSENEILVREMKIKAEEQMRIALTQKREADSFAIIAMQQKKIAVEQKCIAEANALEAMKQRKIAEELKRMMENSLIEAEKARKAAEKLYNEKQKK